MNRKRRGRYRRNRKFKQLKKDVKVLKKGIELKTHTVAQTLTPDDTGGIDPLSRFGAGTNNTDRIGKMIMAKRLHIKWACTKNSSSSGTQMRIVIFSDTQKEDGNMPSVADVLTSVNPLSGYNRIVSLGRFKKFYDKLFVVNTNNNLKSGTIDINLNNRLIYYSGTGASQANEGKNCLYALILSDEPVNTPILEFNSTLFFTDC